MKCKIGLWTASGSPLIYTLLVLTTQKDSGKATIFWNPESFFLTLIRFLAEKSKHQGVKERLGHDSEMVLIFKRVKEESRKHLIG